MKWAVSGKNQKLVIKFRAGEISRLWEWTGEKEIRAISDPNTNPKIVTAKAKVFRKKGTGETNSFVRSGNKAHPATPAPSASRLMGLVRLMYSSEIGFDGARVLDWEKAAKIIRAL